MSSSPAYRSTARPQPGAAPVVPPPAPDSLAGILERNIAALKRRRDAEERQASVQQRIADWITRFAGSMAFVWLHLALVAGWVLVNAGLTPLEPWDPSFVILATIASVEAIFLSTFVLISQNRMAAAADRRADLDLQISLLAEHEVTKLVRLVAEIGERIGVEAARDPELPELEENVAPERVLDRIADEEEGAARPQRG